MSFSLCPYKYIIGKPGEGFHKYRFLGVAIGDVVVVVLFVYLLHLFFNFHFFYTLIITFLLGIIFHRIFCVRTAVDKWLFP